MKKCLRYEVLVDNLGDPESIDSYERDLFYWLPYDTLRIELALYEELIGMDIPDVSFSFDNPTLRPY